jgi:hypothetical protein
MKYLLSFMKIGTGVQTFLGGWGDKHREAHRQQSGLINLFSFLNIRKIGLK